MRMKYKWRRRKTARHDGRLKRALTILLKIVTLMNIRRSHLKAFLMISKSLTFSNSKIRWQPWRHQLPSPKKTWINQASAATLKCLGPLPTPPSSRQCSSQETTWFKKCTRQNWKRSKTGKTRWSLKAPTSPSTLVNPTSLHRWTKTVRCWRTKLKRSDFAFRTASSRTWLNARSWRPRFWQAHRRLWTRTLNS